MHLEVKKHWDAMLSRYSQGPYMPHLLEAKEYYNKLTGVIHDDQDEYESRMNCFNDWYVTEFIPSQGTGTVLKEYIQAEKLDELILESFKSIIHSVFCYHKKNWRGQTVLKDILHKKKYVLPKEHQELGMVKGDVFVGRIIIYDNAPYLLPGICLLPQDVKPQIQKQSRKVRKLKAYEEEQNFLYKLESLKTKYLHYQHVESRKIFVFN